jgi:hypothetical protein
MQLKTLNREKPFIVVCSDGRISEAAAFLLRKNKFEVTILQGGMASVIPQSKNDSDLTDTNNETTVGSPENHHDDDQLTNT